MVRRVLEKELSDSASRYGVTRNTMPRLAAVAKAMGKVLIALFVLVGACQAQTRINVDQLPAVNGIVVGGTKYPATGAGIAAAVAALGSAGGRIILPAGIYTISGNLNLTNLNGITFEGASAYSTTPGLSAQYGTILQINFTGSNTVGVDISGSTDITFRNIVFSCGTSAGNAPTVCLLHGRTSGSNTIRDKLENCYVVGYSPWIYYNYRGEQFSSIDTKYAEYGTTGVPVTLSYANTAGITSPNVTLGGQASESMLYFRGGGTEITSNSTAGTNPAQCLFYLDEGSGGIQDPEYEGYMGADGTSNILVCDTTGASGSITNAFFNIHSESSSATSNTLFSINGVGSFWTLKGYNSPVASTGGPALSFFNLRQSIIQFQTGIDNAASGNCPGTFIQVDIANGDTCTASFRTGGDGQGSGKLMLFYPLNSIGTKPVVTGTGACTTVSLSAQNGGSFAGSIKCGGSTGASTLVITTTLTADNGYQCDASDLTTANALRQSGSSTTTCTISGTVNANDIIVYKLTGF